LITLGWTMLLRSTKIVKRTKKTKLKRKMKPIINQKM